MLCNFRASYKTIMSISFLERITQGDLHSQTNISYILLVFLIVSLLLSISKGDKGMTRT